MDISSSVVLGDIRGEVYKTSSGKIIRGAFHTVEKDVALIQASVLDKLAEGVEFIEADSEPREITESMIPQELIELIEKRAIEKYISNKKTKEDIKKICKENAMKGVAIRQLDARRKAANVLKCILEGNSYSETAYLLGYSYTTVVNALKVKTDTKKDDNHYIYRPITPDEVKGLWDEYRSTLLNNVDMGLLVEFIACNCDYKKYREKIAFEKRVKFRKSVNREVEEMKVYNEGLEDLKKISQGLVEAGHKPLNLHKETKNEVPINSAECEQCDISFEEIIERFNSAPAYDDVANKSSLAVASGDDEDPFIAKYSAKRSVPVQEEKFHYEMSLDDYED